ncbi:MAG TPA: hypothetical protein VKG25_19315 [Bryobacteraceae bacterium]|nr:hypothetical protein [Bryobacteraceae bacterium]
MRLRRLLTFFLVLLGCGAPLVVQTAKAQSTTGACSLVSESDTSVSVMCPQGEVISIDFGQGFAEVASLISGLDGITFSYSITASGNLPTGTTLTPSGLFSGTFAAAGTFSFALDISETIGIEGTSYTFSDSFTYVFIITGYTGAPTTVDPGGLSFSLTQGAAAATQSVSITNMSSQAESFTASANEISGGNWLTVSPSGGSVPSFGAAGVAVTADPSKLAAGTYIGRVTISIAGGQDYTVSVVLTVAGTQPNIVLSQTGLSFGAVMGGSATPPQIITVENSGAGTLNFTATPSTFSNGSWLSVSSGSRSVTVSVNPAGLPVGVYYGQIKFVAQGAVNSPQIASVVLNVVTQANSPGAQVQPSGLIFVGAAGAANPAAKTLSLTNPSPTGLNFVGSSFTNSGGNWLNFTPSSGAVSSTQPTTVSVQPNVQGLAFGVYTGEVVFNFVATGSTTPQTLHIEVLLIVLPAGSVPPSAAAGVPVITPLTSACTPTKLLPVFTQLATGFTTVAAWPTAIEVTVVDDCGKALTTGSVITTFSSGDGALSLTSLKDGRWSGTWQPVHPTTSVTVTAKAQEIQPALVGTQSVGGTLQANTATPVVPAGGVVSAASFIPNQPLAPGAYAAIFGSNLSQSSGGAQQLPLNTQLGITSVTLAGEPMPLLYSSSGQINAVIPYDIPANSAQQIIVQMGPAISVPQTVNIASAQPAIFTADSSGKGAAIFVGFKPDGTPLPANTPLSANDVITVYCTGLGAVNPPVPTGSAAPATPISHTVNTVTATIGGLSANVLFAGLAPGFAQLYQMNITVPSGVTAGNAVLLVSVSGQQSSPVTIPVQ